MIFGVAHFSTIQIFNPQESFVPCINLNMLVDYSSWHRLIFTWKLAFLWSSNAGTEDGCQAVSRGHSKHSDTWANTLASSDLWKLTHALSMWPRLSCWLAPSPHTSWTTKNMPLSFHSSQFCQTINSHLVSHDIRHGCGGPNLTCAQEMLQTLLRDPLEKAYNPLSFTGEDYKVRY